MTLLIIINHLYDEEIVMKFSFNISAFEKQRSNRMAICFPAFEFKVKTTQLSEADVIP